MKEYDSTLTSVSENEIVKGRVTSIQDGDIVLDINFKSDGLVSSSEFRDMPDLAVGDEVEVYVEMQEDARGQLVLSRRKAKLLSAWDSIKDSYTNGTVIKGTVISKTKGGLIVDCGGLETFLPGSQIDIKPIIDYDSYVGKTMEFKVVKINEQIKNAVVSHKALIESDLAEQREKIIASLEKGQVLEGIVKNITDFGAFLDLGGVDGLLYITDISYGRINHPSEVLALNEKINVVVLEFDENKKRISLGLKQLQPHPWKVLDESVQEGAVVKRPYRKHRRLRCIPGSNAGCGRSDPRFRSELEQPTDQCPRILHAQPGAGSEDRYHRSRRQENVIGRSSSLAKIHGVRSKTNSRKAAATRVW